MVSVFKDQRLSHLMGNFVLSIFHMRLKSSLSIGMDLRKRLGLVLSLAWSCLCPKEGVWLHIRVVNVSVIVIVVGVLPQE